VFKILLCCSALLLLACNGREQSERAPPPEGYPLLEGDYLIQSELLGMECYGGGGALEDSLWSASLEQDGDELRWIQVEGSRWKLNGMICPLEEGFEIRLRGSRRLRLRSEHDLCELYLEPNPSPCKEFSLERCDSEPGCYLSGERCRPLKDLCKDPYALRLSLNACHQFEGEFRARLEFRRDCQADPCWIDLRWRGTPKTQGLSSACRL